MAWNIENDIPGVLYNGLNSAKNGTLSGVMTFSGANTHSGIETHSAAETHTGAEVFASGQAATSAGVSQAVFSIGSSTTLGLYFGSATPTISAPQGSLYMRTDGATTSTRLYVNTNGTTGWTGVTTAS